MRFGVKPLLIKVSIAALRNHEAVRVRRGYSLQSANKTTLVVAGAASPNPFTFRRSASLRTCAGDTSLPGGRVDPEDRSLEDAAVRLVPFSASIYTYSVYFLVQRREAFEEVRVKA